MIIICTVCGKIVRYIKPLNNRSIVNGKCDKCYCEDEVLVEYLNKQIRDSGKNLPANKK